MFATWWIDNQERSRETLASSSAVIIVALTIKNNPLCISVRLQFLEQTTQVRLQAIITFSIMTIDTLTFFRTVMARLVTRTVTLVTQTFLARTRWVIIHFSCGSPFSLHSFHNLRSLWGVFSVMTVHTSTLQGTQLACFETFTIQL